MAPNQVQYTRKFEDLNRHQFKEAYTWLANLGTNKESEGYHFVHFDNIVKLEGEHARIDLRSRTVELTDRLNLCVGDFLEHIIEVHKGDDTK